MKIGIDLGTDERRAAADRGVVAVDHPSLGTHPVQLREPIEAVLEDRLVDMRRAARLGEQDRGRGLGVRGEAGVRRGLDIEGFEARIDDP